MSRSRKSRKPTRRDSGGIGRKAAVVTPPAELPSPPSLLQELRARHPAAIALAVVFAAFAYLAFIHLDWALFWDDEATIAYLARNWLEFGAPLVDDGRNIFTFRYGNDLAGGGDINADGTFRYPKFMTAALAVMFAIFGEGEIPARLLSALLSLAALAIFAAILRREFPRRPGLVAVAFAFACLMPLTLGYARSATYNAAVLFFHMAVLWAYLQFCAHKKIAHAAVLTIAAIAAFHAHYSSNVVFLSALAAMHLLFRRREFDRRAWCIAGGAAAVWAAQAVWVYASAFAGESYFYAGGWSAQNFLLHLRIIFVNANQNGMLAWTVFLAFAAWRAWDVARARRGARWVELRDDRAVQYWFFLLAGMCAIVVFKMGFGVPVEIRYFSSFAPFAAVISAAVVVRAWQSLKIAGAGIGAVLLLSNAAAWPLLGSHEHGQKIAWTLPALIYEYHRDYPDSMRESHAYIRENVPRDSLVYTNYRNPGWMLWYLSEHARFCCKLERAKWRNDALDLRARDHLFIDDVLAGRAPPPQYLYMIDLRPVRDSLQFGDGRVYTRLPDFPGSIMGTGPLVRPEPALHASRPQKMRARPHKNVMQLYKLQTAAAQK